MTAGALPPLPHAQPADGHEALLADSDPLVSRAELQQTVRGEGSPGRSLQQRDATGVGTWGWPL